MSADTPETGASAAAVSGSNIAAGVATNSAAEAGVPDRASSGTDASARQQHAGVDNPAHPPNRTTAAAGMHADDSARPSASRSSSEDSDSDASSNAESPDTCATLEAKASADDATQAAQAPGAGAQPVARIGAPPTEHLCAYELERAARIARNHAMLVALGVVGPIGASSLSDNNSTNPKRGSGGAKRARGAAATGNGATPGVMLQPTRGPSARQAARRGEPVIANSNGEEAEGEGVPPQALEQLYTQEEYLKLLGKEVPQDHYVTDGRFTGWVPPDVITRHGLPHSEEEYERRKAAGAYRKHGAKGKVKDAKAFSATQLTSNPNAYFFRHVAPGEVQNLGPWSAEETEAFMDICREHGVGGTFGLFASYTRTRVGYQCSAFYKQVLLPSGMVIDARYKMTKQGRPILCGGGVDDTQQE